MSKHPDKMGPPDESWMCLTDEGPEYFETEEEAKEEAESALQDYVLSGEVAAACRVVVAKVTAFGVNKNDEYPQNSDGDEDIAPADADVYDYELRDVVETDLETIARLH